MSVGARVRAYYSLTKPHVTYGNVITTVAGFLLAASIERAFHTGLFLATTAGTTLVVAAACVLNNYLDQDIDRIMERTKTRAIVRGAVAGWRAVIFSAVLGVVGTVMLALWVNSLVVIIGLVGFVTYVWLYGVLSKRRSIHGTLVGSISGALPIVAGYCAVVNRIDRAAVLLFLCLFFWQFLEFYSISIYRRKEYKAAHVPVMSVVKGVRLTKIQIFVYTILFAITTVLLSVLGYTGWIYGVTMIVLNLYLIWLGKRGLALPDTKSDDWARKMFHMGLTGLLIFSCALSVGALLP